MLCRAIFSAISATFGDFGITEKRVYKMRHGFLWHIFFLSNNFCFLVKHKSPKNAYFQGIGGEGRARLQFCNVLHLLLKMATQHIDGYTNKM